MELGAATHFSQGWSVEIVEPAQQIGVKVVRDTVSWTEIEAESGVYDFSDTRAAYPGFLAVMDFDVRLVFAFGNPLYDDGATPHTPEGRTAFADFVAEVLRRYPLVRVIEIGNEFNAQNFVSGPIADAPYAERAAHYASLLNAVTERVKAEFPNVTILGGAAHSIPVAYLRAQAEHGVLENSDGLAFHPYTSPPEHVETHLSILRDALAPADPPLHATEFGGDFDTLEEAAPYLIRMATALAAAEVKSSIWYSLREQPWYNHMELLSREGDILPAGESFGFLQNALLSLGPVKRIPSDPFTRVYSFGDRALVAWGLPRAISIDAEVEWRDARGRPVDPRDAIDPVDPIVVLSDEPVNFGTALRLGHQAAIADSFYEFDPRLDADGYAGNWAYHAVRGDGAVEPLALMEGGAKQSEAWRPYIGNEWRRPLMVHETGLRPADFSDGAEPTHAYAVRERFIAPADVNATVCGIWQVREDSSDGITLKVSIDDAIWYEDVIKGRVVVRLDDLQLAAGSTVDFLVGSNGNTDGDWTMRRVRVVEPLSADRLCKFDDD